MITGKRIQFWGLVATCVVPAVHAICGGTDILIETTGPGLSILSGCYNVSSYAGLYQTTVFTIEGKDFSEEGSPTILADLVSLTQDDSVVLHDVRDLSCTTMQTYYGIAFQTTTSTLMSSSKHEMIQEKTRGLSLSLELHQSFNSLNRTVS